jgi:rhodanese-related sulfurtransferase
VVLYCASGARSTRAAALLRAEGFEAVHNLGAMSAW